MKKEKDRFAEDKKEAYEKIFGEGTPIHFTFDLGETWLGHHEAREYWFCYICDKPIGMDYYSYEPSDPWYRRKICLRCVARIIDFFKIDLEKYREIRQKLMEKLYKEK